MKARVWAAWAAMVAGLMLALSGLMVGNASAIVANPVTVEGNVDSCAQAGYPNATMYYAGAGGGASGQVPGGYFTVTITTSQYVTISNVADGVTFYVVIVKGGSAYNIYNPPVANMVSPLNNGGNVPAISHWFACFDYDPPEPECDDDPTTDIPPCVVTCEDDPTQPECEVSCDEDPTQPECEVSCDEDPTQPECEVTCEDDPTQPECEVSCEEEPDQDKCWQPELTVAPYCKVVDTDGNTIKEWFDITNPNDDTIEVEWAGDSTEINAASSARVSAAGPGIEVEIVGYDGDTWTSGSPDDVCSRTVEFTKDVEGTTGDEEYTITVSRLVPPNYVVEETFQISNGETVTLDLPSTGDGTGFTYKIEETDPGTANAHSVTPGEITLTGHLGETVSVVIVNSYAAIELDKQVSATSVQGGDELTYTLQAHNTGALALEDVEISDLLPADVMLASWEIEDDAGTCNLVDANQPQLVVCEMDDVLPVDGFTKTITLTVTVDADVAIDTILLNQAKVVGFYIDPQQQEGSLDAARANRTQAEEALSCLPVPDGAVCDLSAKVGSTVTGDTTTTTDQGSGAGTPTTTTIVRGNLPETGASSGSLVPFGLLVFGMGVLTLLLSRRPASR